MIDSKEYWENRYKLGGNSGAGSYGRLANFKADFINYFILTHSINDVVEFGCGDGNQLSLFKCEYYTGYDVSETVINLCKERFKDQIKFFYLYDTYKNRQYDLSLSLDVIFHLVEDMVFEDYMRKLFTSAQRYVIIYSSNGNTKVQLSPHMLDRRFTDWIELNVKNFVLIDKIENPYKYRDSLDDPLETSMCDFYVYKKI